MLQYSAKWQKILKTPKKVAGPVGKEGVLVKVKNTAALELEETRFLRWLHMSCRLDIYRFYVGESTISRIISDLNFPPLCQNLSPKCKQTLINLSPKFVLTLRCYVSSELGEPPNEREETRTPIASLHTNDVSNGVILTNHWLFTMMMFIVRKNIFCGQPNQETPYFHRRRTQFCTRFHSGRVNEVLLSSMWTEDRYVNFRRRLHRFSQWKPRK